MKVCSPDGLVKEADSYTGNRLNLRGGIVDADPRDAKALVAAGGFYPSMAGTTRRSVGYRCTSCGFGSFFAKCSRCDSPARKEG